MIFRRQKEEANETEKIIFSEKLTSIIFKGRAPAMQETWVQSLGWEDLLEKG